jgi:hypothetical protein
MKKITSIMLGAILIGGIVLGSITLAGADENNELEKQILKQDKIADKKSDTSKSSRSAYSGYHHDNDNDDNDNNDNDDDECGDDKIRTIKHEITSDDSTNSVVIGPVCAKMFVMIFKTDSDYDGSAEFQAELEDGSWVQVGPSQFSGLTSVGGMDSIPTDNLKLPITIRVEVTDDADNGTSLAQIDFIAGSDSDDDDNDNNDNDDNDNNDNDDNDNNDNDD